jgi:hypothetical protein
MIEHSDYLIRLGTLNDVPFIKDAWLKTMRHIYPHQFEVDFAQNYQSHMQTLIDNSITLVAHLKEDEDDILSFLVYTFFRGHLICHFAYTKADIRNQGLLNELLKWAGPVNQSLIMTHPTKNENLMAHFMEKYLFDPTIIGKLPCL